MTVNLLGAEDTRIEEECDVLLMQYATTNCV